MNRRGSEGLGDSRAQSAWIAASAPDTSFFERRATTYERSGRMKNRFDLAPAPLNRSGLLPTTPITGRGCGDWAPHAPDHVERLRDLAAERALSIHREVQILPDSRLGRRDAELIGERRVDDDVDRRRRRRALGPDVLAVRLVEVASAETRVAERVEVVEADGVQDHGRALHA